MGTSKETLDYTTVRVTLGIIFKGQVTAVEPNWLPEDGLEKSGSSFIVRYDQAPAFRLRTAHFVCEYYEVEIERTARRTMLRRDGWIMQAICDSTLQPSRRNSYGMRGIRR